MVSIWDIETGKIVQKFGPAHGEGNKITAGSFDSTQRRLITAGSDGSVKIWNFSNGQCLKDLLSEGGKTKVDQEMTAIVCIFDPADEEVDENG
jgi:WD40 repeat protein